MLCDDAVVVVVVQMLLTCCHADVLTVPHLVCAWEDFVVCIQVIVSIKQREHCVQ